MANFPEVKTGGWTNGETLTGAQATQLQQQNDNSVNGAGGSSHNGHVRLGGIMAPHVTDEVLDSGPHSGASITVTWDVENDGNCLHLVSSRNNATQGSIEITMTGMEADDWYTLVYENTAGQHDDYQVVFDNLSEQLQEDGGDELPIIAAPGVSMSIFRGRAKEDNLVVWSCVYRGPRL